MKVSAAGKGTVKSESITVTNEKGLLSKEEIECMVREAELMNTSPRQASFGRRRGTSEAIYCTLLHQSYVQGLLACYHFMPRTNSQL
ncbi:hypothetical protein EDC04DRAFT_2773418, partial [Pisolithus marmoratus]